MSDAAPTPVDLDLLEALEAAATPGPWFVRHLDDAHSMSAVALTTRPDDGQGSMRFGTWPQGEVVAATLIQQPCYVDAGDGRWDDNAALIAEVRNALPELLRLARVGAAALAAGWRPEADGG